MNDSYSISKHRLLVHNAQDFQSILSDIAQRYERGGTEANAAIKRLQRVLAHQVRHVLHALSCESDQKSEVAEIGARLLCTAVRVSEVTFSRDERVTWFEAFESSADQFKDLQLKGQFLGNYGNVLADCGRLDDAEFILQKRLRCAIDENDPVAEGLAKEHIGKLLLRRGWFQKGDRYLESAFDIATKLGEEATITRLLKDKADSAFRNEQIADGIRYLEKRLSIGERAKDPLLILSTRQIIAERLLVIGKLDESKTNAAEAFKLAKQLRIPLRVAAVYGTLGNIALEEKAYGKAHEYFTKARKVFRKYHRLIEQSMTATSLGLTAWKQGKLSQAVRWFRDALEIDRAVGRKNDLAIDLGNLADVLSEIGDFEGAVLNYSERIQVLEEIEESSRAADTRMKLAQVHLSTKQHDLAISIGKEAFEYYSQHNQEKSKEIQSLIAKWQDTNI